MKIKTIIQIILGIAILILAYFIVESIAKPIRYEKEKAKRYAKVIERLKDIRTAQLAYKSVYGEFSGDFDKLIDFVKNDSFPVIKQIGDIEDSLAVARGEVIRDTIKLSVLDSLFRKKYPIDSLRFVPFTDDAEFILGASEIVTGSKVKVKVFEAIDSKPYDPSHVLKVGSLTEATNNTGNWE